MPQSRSEPTLSIAFIDIANSEWTAGAHYFKNLFSALRSLDEHRRPRIVVAMSPSSRRSAYDTYRDLADEIIELPRRASPRSSFTMRQLRRLRRKLGLEKSHGRQVERAFRGHGVDVLFQSWADFVPDVGLPTLGWIHDFQHLHHAELFSPADRTARDRIFTELASQCSRVVLSSEDARRDYEAFLPMFASKARVLRFVAEPPADIYDTDPELVCASYHLPERFVFLPNQFWLHKNHGLVIDALAQLRSTRPEIVVVCSGNPGDPRAPLHFGELLARVAQLGLRDNFIVVGWIPHEHTFHLLRQSIAVLQPSLFEGWSTTVEETKSIGKTILLSDIPIHREQAPPSARYFDPADPSELAARLIEAYDSLPPGPDIALETMARAALPVRRRVYADAFVQIARDAIVARVADSAR